MNALLVSPAYDHSGGAVIAANRLFQGLKSRGVDTKMLVGKSSFEDDTVKIVPHNLSGEKLISRINIPLGLNYIHYYSSFNIPNHAFFKQADVINFHTIHSGYFNYLALARLTRDKPAVFTMHDMWAFTGHCSFSYTCTKWENGCGNCPDLSIFPEVQRDATAIEWKLKRRTYRRSNLTFVAPSIWLANLAKKSILKEHPIHHIPNGLDTKVFAPADKRMSRETLGIPGDKTVILFGAMGLSDKRKGGELILETLGKLNNDTRSNLFLLTFGTDTLGKIEELGIAFKQLGYIKEDKMKSVIFSASDIFLFPSKADNLPCIIQESMACGTPTVATDIGGIPELVRPGITGLLFTPESAEDFKNKIEELIRNREMRDQMADHCRRIAVEEYDISIQARKYESLFKELKK